MDRKSYFAVKMQKKVDIYLKNTNQGGAVRVVRCD